MALEHVFRRGKRAKERRENLKLTQEDVAERIQEIHAERNPGSPRDKTRGQMISDYERGVNDPRGARLELWAAALDWTVGDLEADRPAKSNGDFMDQLADAEEDPSLKQVEDRIAALETRLLARLGEAQSELEDLLSPQVRPKRKQGSKRS